MSRSRAFIFGLTLLLGFAGGCAENPAAKPPPPAASVPLAKEDVAPIAVFPQRRELEGYTLVIYAPQIRSWPDFERFEAWVAIELTPPDGAATVYGTAVLKGDTEIDMPRRLVQLSDKSLERVIFADQGTPALEDVVQRAVRDEDLEIPLDLFLAYLSDDVLSDPPPAGFNAEAPPIVVRSTPTILLFVNGDTVPADVADTGLELVVNANWPLFTHDSAYFLLYRDQWLTSSRLDGGWSFARSLPAGFASLPAEDNFAAVRAALPLQASSGEAPQVLYVKVPTELIVTEGKPDVVAIADTDGLGYVANTDSPLFKLGDDWYYLTAGRWFRSSQLQQGDWTWVPELPEAFSRIPEDHPMEAVLASVPGTEQAKMAALEASLPTKKVVDREATPEVEVVYAGEPKFEPVEGTSVARAVNSGYDILEFEGRYYLCYGGAWYVADAPTGPWSVTADVPSAIYEIPPDSPAYDTTQVKVASSTASAVTYTYPASYSSGVYVVYGVPYYGTGWYYPPYYYGGYYYPFWGSYGHGSWYNPATGGYGSRSVWYGPYGGYSYSQGYNPTSGRYGWVETAWDGNERGSYGETYNPRTGVGTETSRYYNEDDNRSKMERTTQRGDKSIETQRKVNYDKGTAQVERETSGGASSSTERQYDSGTGTLSSEGSITGKDGSEYSVSGEQTRGGGSTTITGDAGSVDMETKRQDGRSVTGMEGSGGGQGISVSGEGAGRTTVIESGSGDLYAGHDGSVYKKTDSGWQQYENGNWSPAETPQRSESLRSEQVQATSSNARQGESAYRSESIRATPDISRGGAASQARPSSLPSQGYDRNHSQLNRDYTARQRGQQQFQRRSMGSGMGGNMGGSRMGRRR